MRRYTGSRFTARPIAWRLRPLSLTVSRKTMAKTVRNFSIAVAAMAFSTPALAQGPALPTGELMVASGGAGNVSFVSTDFKREGDVIEAVGLDVHEPGMEVAGDLGVKIVWKRRVDCKGGTYQELGTSVYNAAGKVILTMPQEPARPVGQGGYAMLSQIVCGGMRAPPEYIAAGHDGAVILAHKLLAARR